MSHSGVQLFFDLRSDLRGFEINPLAVKMNVVAVVFGMPPDEGVQVVHWNAFRLDEFQSDGIPPGNPFVGGLSLIVRRQFRRNF